jgi:hypothetical protein
MKITLYDDKQIKRKELNLKDFKIKENNSKLVINQK